MTQDVQPLTWQKRTNLEEHQQFFSKINEIIDNLAPTVDEAEAAIAQATAAIASANDAIATANAASAAASAAASQAQTAASTVAGYNTRLTAAEGDIDAAEGDIDAAEGDIAALQGRMGTAEGKITAIEGREADYLKKTGAAQTVTSQIMVPTTATGVRDTQIANGTRIQNDLAAYESMMRTTGSQNYTGIKKALGLGFIRKQSASLNLSAPAASGSITDENYVMEDVNGATAVQVFNSVTAGSQTIFQIATKYPFVDNDEVKQTNGILWLAVYSDRAVLYLRFIDKNGTGHMQAIATVTE